MVTILAFDQSIKRTGWALAEVNERGKVFLNSIKFGSFTAAPRTHMDTEEKCDVFARAIIDLLDKERPDFVIWEAARDDIVAYPRKVTVKVNPSKTTTGDMFAGTAAQKTKMLPATVNADQLILRDIQGQIRQACFERKIPFDKVYPKTWRADLFGAGYGNMETEAAKKHAVATCHRDRIMVSNGDQAEAACIARWAATCSVRFRKWLFDGLGAGLPQVKMMERERAA